jgi:hypothetical protein
MFLLFGQYDIFRKVRQKLTPREEIVGTAQGMAQIDITNARALAVGRPQLNVNQYSRIISIETIILTITELCDLRIAIGLVGITATV